MCSLFWRWLIFVAQWHFVDTDIVLHACVHSLQLSAVRLVLDLKRGLKCPWFEHTQKIKKLQGFWSIKIQLCAVIADSCTMVPGINEWAKVEHELVCLDRFFMSGLLSWFTSTTSSETWSQVTGGNHVNKRYWSWEFPQWCTCMSQGLQAGDFLCKSISVQFLPKARENISRKNGT